MGELLMLANTRAAESRDADVTECFTRADGKLLFSSWFSTAAAAAAAPSFARVETLRATVYISLSRSLA